MNSRIQTSNENYRNVFRLIYEKKEISKQEIADGLSLSLPTVSNNLQRLEKNGLILKSGTFSSTGGRPAVIYRLNSEARFAVGVEITASSFHIAAVDLYGYILRHNLFEIPFEHSENYYRTLAESVNQFTDSLSDEAGTKLLGITLAVQGIVSADGREVIFSGLLGRSNISHDDFAPWMKYPFILVHDAEAAGYAEMWFNRDVKNAAYFSMNRYMGSAMIIDGRLMNSPSIGGGTLEHMVIYPGGKACYCGGHGCADTVLRLSVLHQGSPLEEFFEKVRKGSKAETARFEKYLSDLAIVIYNVRMVTDCDVILGGTLEEYLYEEDYEKLYRLVGEKSSLGSHAFRIIPGHYGDKAALIGAGMIPVERFLSSFGNE